MGKDLNILSSAEELLKNYNGRVSAQESEYIRIGDQYLDLIPTLDHANPLAKVKRASDGSERFIKTIYGTKVKSIEIYASWNNADGYMGNGFTDLQVKDLDDVNILSGVYPSYTNHYNKNSDRPTSVWGSWSYVTDANANTACGVYRPTDETVGNDYQGSITMRWDLAESKELKEIYVECVQFSYNDTGSYDARKWEVKVQLEDDTWSTILTTSTLANDRVWTTDNWTHRTTQHTLDLLEV